jgi:hypothetical protein
MQFSVIYLEPTEEKVLLLGVQKVVELLEEEMWRKLFSC